MEGKTKIKVTIAKTFNKIGRFDVLLDIVGHNDKRLPEGIYLEMEADSVEVLDATQKQRHDDAEVVLEFP